jgi:uncharacterized protein
MRRNQVLQLLRRHRQDLQAFAVQRLAVFGSVARDEAHESSDVDILVEFQPGARVGLFGFVRLQRYLSEILDCPVDLATPEALRKEMREQILREAIDAA